MPPRAPRETGDSPGLIHRTIPEYRSLHPHMKIGLLSVRTLLFGALLSPLAALAQSRATIEARPPHHVHTFAAAAPIGYTPAQIRHAYGIDLLKNSGSGQTIAIVAAYGSPTAQNDLNVFSAKFGLPAASLTTYYANRKPSTVDAGWAFETSLDLQWAHAMAPAARLILVVAPTSGVSDLLAAVRVAGSSGASVVSMSWGVSEFWTETAYESYFNRAGVTFLASSGDNGAGASWPATSPSVVAVGGTTLHLDASGNVTSPESAWSGSGGGYSSYFGRPSYQNGWQGTIYRAFPDVSLVADPATGVTIYDTTAYSGQTGWFQVGGTSAASPMWAGIIALTNELHLAAGTPALTGSTAALYRLAAKTSSTGASYYSYYFFDVTAGSNGYSATPRFDTVTGLGTPIVPNVATDLK